MVKFEILFKDSDPLKVTLQDSNLASNYYNLLKSKYQEDANVVFRDKKYYTLDVFQELAKQANDCLGWTWDISDLSISNLTAMHKDIEHLVGAGYEDLPAEYDNLVHDIHYALHSIETNNERGAWLQLSWYTDEGFSISPEEYPGKKCCKFGDIKLDNPWVGHNPSMVFMQDDYTAISETCKFHDWAKPGMNILIENYGGDIDVKEYYDWFTTHDPEFVETHTWKTIESYLGEAVVGNIVNLDTLEEILKKPYLEFEKFVFLD